MSPSRFRSWQSRFFRLTNWELSYYSKEDEQKPKGVLDFGLQTVNFSLDLRSNRGEILIAITSNQRLYRLRPATDEELRLWVIALTMHIYSSTANRHSVRHFAEKEHFWGHGVIPNREFVQQATTFDLLLFKERESLGKGGSSQEADRAAVLIRYATKELGFLEEWEGGIRIVKWEEFVRFKVHLLYSQVIFRKLLMPIPQREEIVPELENFLRHSTIHRLTHTPAMTMERLKPDTSSASFVTKIYACAGLFDRHRNTQDVQVTDFSGEPEFRLRARLETGLYIRFGK